MSLANRSSSRNLRPIASQRARWLGGAACTAAQTDFVDQSRTDYKVMSGTFTSKQLADSATCADVRAALPM